MKKSMGIVVGMLALPISHHVIGAGHSTSLGVSFVSYKLKVLSFRLKCYCKDSLKLSVQIVYYSINN